MQITCNIVEETENDILASALTNFAYAPRRSDININVLFRTDGIAAGLFYTRACLDPACNSAESLREVSAPIMRENQSLL